MSADASTDEMKLEYSDELIREIREMAEMNVAVVIHGEVGRTRLLRSIYPSARICDAREFLEPKNLLGFYVVRNGEIQYVNGLLVDAMSGGSMLCFRNIDRNMPLLQILRPVFSDGTVTASNGQLVRGHPDFRLFMTAAAPFRLRNVAFVGPVCFSLERVLESFGCSRKPIEEAVEFIGREKQEKCLADRGGACDGICPKEDSGCSCGKHVCARHFKSLCDLYLCLSDSRREALPSSSQASRSLLHQAVANILLKHDSTRIREFLYVRVDPLTLPNMNFAKTAAAEFAMRNLIGNIRCGLPTLLVGETGAGKTAIVQYVCDNSEYFFGRKASLQIVNMSADFDGSSLVGNYQSIDFDQSIRSLFRRAGMRQPPSLCRRDLLLRVAAEAPADIAAEAAMYLRMLGRKLAFVYKEGILTRAMVSGDWLLIDEINLATEETLGLIEAVLSTREIILYESGCLKPVRVHDNFRIFACMNPHGDFGKKKYESRRFTRLIFYDFSSSLPCIRSVVMAVSRNRLRAAMAEPVASFYYELKQGLVSKEYGNIIEPLVTGRTLCRAIALILRLQDENDSFCIFHAFNLLFFSQFDLSSRARAIALFKRHFPAQLVPAQALDRTGAAKASRLAGSVNFIVTPKVKMHIDDVELAISTSLPVLLQGDTSTGKTSLVLALARKHERRVIRINNHEHTDAADYIGSYITAGSRIVFKEGALVSALRSGFWLILDELNLAPSDVLEVLNRLLDDNREIYIPETDEVVRPHPNFRLFATQNLGYSGRRGLAKSFRNRFVEIFFYEKDASELRDILSARCKLPDGFTKLIMAVYSGLKSMRSIDSFITLRELFKWAQRGPRSYYEIYEIGLDILLSRQRTAADREMVRRVFDGTFGERMRFESKDYACVYGSRYEHAVGLLSSGSPDGGCQSADDVDVECEQITKNGGARKGASVLPGIGLELFRRVTSGLIVTRSYLALFDAIYKAWAHSEPVLLIGQTGIGKTRICAAMAAIAHVRLRTVNMYGGIECSDFVGHSVLDHGEVKWVDGPLIEALVGGDALLIDEINLAEDAVIERINSVLEDRRTLFVTERSQEYAAHDSFRIIATMNPGGDHGKRELSPALRNRFTEIYFVLEPSEHVEIFTRMLERTAVPDQEYFIEQFGLLGRVLSVRRIELLVSLLSNLSVGREEPGLFRLDSLAGARESMWSDAMEMFGLSAVSSENAHALVSRGPLLGIFPYFLYCGSGLSSYCFDSPTARSNLKRLIRALTLGRGVLLEGDPGVGKTSMVRAVAGLVNIPVIRINLSEHTEMSDLVGTYLPMGLHIRFVESELVEYIRMGYWVLLDEVNLCTQSVIEGLNSLLDHRRSILVDGVAVSAHERTRIFGTLNPVNSRNGRKHLPKSFLDRFVTIPMGSYSAEDTRLILRGKYGTDYLFDPGLSLRGNEKLNELGDGRDAGSEAGTEYCVAGGTVQIGSVRFPYQYLDESYVLVQSQLPQIRRLLSCLEKRIPVVLTGPTGRTPLLRFVCGLLGLALRRIDCHGETDIADLLGQYVKAETGEALFEWRDSLLVSSLAEESLIVINGAELVDKCVFDRLSSLFESERSLSIIERGIDPTISVNEQCRVVICCDEPSLLSPALIDRCCLIELDSRYSYLDLFKMFSDRLDTGRDNQCSDDVTSIIKRVRSDHERFREFARLEAYTSEIGQSTFDNKTGCNALDLMARKHAVSRSLPSCLRWRLPVFNCLTEESIDELFKVATKEAGAYDREALEKYRRIREYSSPRGHDFRARVDNLVRRPDILTLLKNMDYESLCPLGCRGVPASLAEYKLSFVSSLRQRKLADYEDVSYFVQKITAITQFVRETPVPDSSPGPLSLFEEDPLIQLKLEVESERAVRENRLLARIREVAKSIYKYGDLRGTGAPGSSGPYSVLDGLFSEYGQVSAHYENLIASINNQLGRDYSRFKNIAARLTFCEYVREAETREYLEQFSDLFDYCLVRLFSDRQSWCRCLPATGHGSSHTTRDLYLLLLRHGCYTSLTNNEYCRAIYDSYTGHDSVAGSECKHSAFIAEALCTDAPVDISTLSFYSLSDGSACPASVAAQLADGLVGFSEAEIDGCLKGLLPRKTTAQIIETRKSCVKLGPEYPRCIVTDSCSIFSSAEFLVELLRLWKIENASKLSTFIAADGAETETTDRLTESVESSLLFLTSLFRDHSCLAIDRNFRYFGCFLPTGPLASHRLSLGSLETYFMGCLVYEYLDRMFFAVEYLRVDFSALLYNSILRFKAFGIEEMAAKKGKECRIKLHKEPSMYEKTISDYLDRFLHIPITSVAAIKFEQPPCQGTHSGAGPRWLLKSLPQQSTACAEQAAACECDAWNKLAAKHNKDEILGHMGEARGNSVDRIVQAFHSRVPDGEWFGYSDICLAKVVSTVLENINKKQYTPAEETCLLNLLAEAISYPSPPFLYFIYRFSDLREPLVEEGVSLKSGQGHELIEEDVKEEDIVDDYDPNQNDNPEADGIEMDNEGEMHSVSGEEQDGESEVDAESNTGEQGPDDQRDRGTTGEVEAQGEKEEHPVKAVDEGDDAEEDETGGTVDDKQESTASAEASGDDSGDDSDDSGAAGSDSEDSGREGLPGLNGYDWTEAPLNRTQTCEQADSYNRKVEGGNLEERDALTAGDGPELVEGHGEAGHGQSASQSVHFPAPSAAADSSKLIQLLRILLAANKTSKYRGDYKTGKKLNLKKIIPYIASDYRKDRIWMRKQRRDRPDYNIRLFIDNSKSMFDQRMVNILAEIYYKLHQAFSALGIPLQLFRFGESLTECTVSDLTFTDARTTVDWIDDFTDGINIILTDGIFQSIGSYRDNFLVIMIDKGNIRKMSSVSLIDNRVFVEKYLDNFSLRYCIVDQIEDLERVFIGALESVIQNIE